MFDFGSWLAERRPDQWHLEEIDHRLTWALVYSISYVANCYKTHFGTNCTHEPSHSYWPVWPNSATFYNFGKILKAVGKLYLGFGHNFVTSLAIFEYFHCTKWLNIEKIPSHLVTLLWRLVSTTNVLQTMPRHYCLNFGFQGRKPPEFRNEAIPNDFLKVSWMRPK